MWRILKSEIRYNRVNFAVFLIIIPPVLVYAAYRPSSTPFFIVWLMAFLAINNWNAFRIREKREFQLVQLPVSVRQIALARLVMVTGAPAVFMLFFALLYSVLSPARGLHWRGLLTLYGLVVMIFSLAFIFRDRFLGTKLLKQGKIAIVALVGLGVVANIYALIAFRRAGEAGREPPAFLRALEYIIENNPSTTSLRTAAFLAASLAIAGLTIVTFRRRRTYIE
jgi:hypothetical protein